MERRKAVDYVFAYRGPKAKAVQLVGSFNGWDPRATSMQKQETGMWLATMQLAPGRHEYKFVVDGEWRREPACEESDRGCPHCVRSPIGTMNCVLNIPD